jgi:hypothetical protein
MDHRNVEPGPYLTNITWRLILIKNITQRLMLRMSAKSRKLAGTQDCKILIMARYNPQAMVSIRERGAPESSLNTYPKKRQSRALGRNLGGFRRVQPVLNIIA